LGSGQGSVAESCKHGNGPFSSTNGGEFIRQMSDYWLPTKNTAEWSLVLYTTYCCGKCNFINSTQISKLQLAVIKNLANLVITVPKHVIKSTLKEKSNVLHVPTVLPPDIEQPVPIGYNV